MSTAVTMRDIARTLSVSVATVSMSLRNQPNISEEVRARVAAKAVQLGYTPHPYVSALMRTRRAGGRAGSAPPLAIVDGLAHLGGWQATSSMTLRLIREGALERLQQLGYSSNEFSLAADGMSPKRLGDIFRARGIRGVLLGPLPDGAPMPALDWSQFSVIGIGPSYFSTAIHSISNDHYFSSIRILQECLNLGYRRPGLLLRESHRVKFQGRWEAGFLHGQHTLPGLESVAPLFSANPEDPATFPEEEFSAWLKEEMPDVIVGIGTDVVERFLKKRRNARSQLGLASLSSPALGSRLSGIFQNGKLIGATAIELLLASVERNATGLPAQAMATMVEGVWNPGKTLPRQG